MKNCKKIAIVLKLFYMVSCASLWAQEFKTVDLDRLLRNHPVASQYDSSTGRFENTPSQIFSEKELESQIARLREVITTEEVKKAELVRKSVSEQFGENAEEKLWWLIRSTDETLQKAKNDLLAKEKLLSIGGVPGINTVHEVVRSIYSDVRRQYSENGRVVILNRLPSYFPSPVKLKYAREDLLSFFYNPSEERLRNYLRCSHAIGMLFSATSNPVLYQKGSPE